MAGRTGYWQTSFRQGDSFTERTRAGHSADTDAEAAGDPCSRESHCAGRRIVTENGERKVIPARTYGPFCVSCRGLIASCLSELPPAYERLGAEIPEPHKRGGTSTMGGAFGPRLPFDASYQELMTRIAQTVLSFEERVRSVAGLSVLDTALSRRRDQYGAVCDAVRLLSHDSYFSALLALPAEPMMRSVPDRSRPDAIELVELDGKAAGEEILSLHRRALLVLGEIVKQRELIDGVPCRRCESMSLFRYAEPPSDPAKEIPWSEVPRMSRGDGPADVRCVGGDVRELEQVSGRSVPPVPPESP